MPYIASAFMFGCTHMPYLEIHRLVKSGMDEDAQSTKLVGRRLMLPKAKCSSMDIENHWTSKTIWFADTSCYFFLITQYIEMLFFLITQYIEDTHHARTLIHINTHMQTLPLRASSKIMSANPRDSLVGRETSVTVDKGNRSLKSNRD
jgi:hypothetical protein